MVRATGFSLIMVKYAGYTRRTQKVINSHQNEQNSDLSKIIMSSFCQKADIFKKNGLIFILGKSLFSSFS